jgi:hypothetical protein
MQVTKKHARASKYFVDERDPSEVADKIELFAANYLG